MGNRLVRTFADTLMSPFWHLADMRGALHMSAFDPKRIHLGTRPRAASCGSSLPGGWQLSVPILEHDIHAHELGEIPRTHSLHHPRSMIFDRAKADAQMLRNFLI